MHLPKYIVCQEMWKERSQNDKEYNFKTRARHFICIHGLFEMYSIICIIYYKFQITPGDDTSLNLLPANKREPSDA